MPELAEDMPCTLGELRWKVTLASRVEVQDRNSATLIEDYRTIAVVYAKLVPIAGLEFYGAVQLETPVTHRGTFRWHPVGYFDTLIRHIELNGKRWQEVYRVRRMTEWQGRHRFIITDLELEKVTQCQ